MDTENGQSHVKAGYRKSIIKIIQLVLLCACSFLLTGCGMWNCSGDTNTREEAVRLTHGERLSRRLAVGADYWFYFDLDEAGAVAFVYTEGYNEAYLYAESDTMPELMQGAFKRGKLNPDTFDETKRLAGDGFETRELAAGKYYLHLHGLVVEPMQSTSLMWITILIVDDLPALPTGTVQSISPNTGEGQLENGYYTLDLTEDSDFTADAVTPEGVEHSVYFYYGENSSEFSTFSFEKNHIYNYRGEDGVSSSIITLPLGRTIVKVNTYIEDSNGGTQPDATVKYTIAAPGTVFDRKVSALPDLPLGEELNLSEFNLEFEFNVYRLYGQYSMHIDLTEDSVLSVLVKGLDPGCSLTVEGYNKTSPLSSVKKRIGGVWFSEDNYINDKTSFKLPAGLNLVELRVELKQDYSAKGFAATTIEFNISPVIEG